MKAFFSLIFCLFLVSESFSQVKVPVPEKIYGGRINAIALQPYVSDSSRIFITCESANSGFYATVKGATGTVGEFRVIPGLSKDKNYGGGIRQIEADSLSEYLFFIHQSGLMRTKPTSPIVYTVYSGNVSSFKIYKNHLFFIEGSSLHYGTISSTGVFTEGLSSPIAVAVSGNTTIASDPVTEKIYIAVLGTSPTLQISSARYDSFSFLTSFLSIGTIGLTASVNWTAFNAGPDGRMFFAGNLGDEIYFAHKNDGLLWTSYNTARRGVGANNIAFAGDTSSYTVFHGKIYNTGKGISSVTWAEVGNAGLETHPNDGCIAVDPKNRNMIFVTSDLGIAASVNGGANIFEIDDGILAIEINDFDMTDSKGNGWMATKSGVRRVSDFSNRNKKWSSVMYPNFDGSPYFSAEIKGNDTNTCYLGNVRVYKTTDNGTTWQQKFTAENTPYNYSSTMSRIEAIEVCRLDESIVFSGYYIDGDDRGGVFYSLDDGNSWSQILVNAASGYQDVDVMDIAFNKEGSDTVAYIGAAYNPSVPAGGRSVYRLVKRGSAWTAAKDMDATHTVGGYEYIVSINDIFVSVSGDTILACGTDAGTNHPVAYFKILSGTGKWTPFTTSGFPIVNGKQGKAITLGCDTTFCAVDHEIYAITPSSSAWWNYYSYTEGAKINFLYYDALLAGTGTGMDNFEYYSVTSAGNEGINKAVSFGLSQNYPNPFNPTTTIKFELTKTAKVSLFVYNALGEKVAELVNGFAGAGVHSIQFDWTKLPSGVYYSVMESDNIRQARKMLLVK